MGRRECVGRVVTSQTIPDHMIEYAKLRGEWDSPDSKRGTLTLLRHGTYVLGCPAGTADYTRTQAKHLVERWMAGEAGGLTLPFPVEVSDLR
jgi:hypothetical protein